MQGRLLKGTWEGQRGSGPAASSVRWDPSIPAVACRPPLDRDVDRVESKGHRPRYDNVMAPAVAYAISGWFAADGDVPGQRRNTAEEAAMTGGVRRIKSRKRGLDNASRWIIR